MLFWKKQASVVQNSLRTSCFASLVLGFLGADLRFDFLAEWEGLSADTNSGDILGRGKNYFSVR